MLEVRSEDNGIWVGNRNRRVWITSYLLDAKAQFTSVVDQEEGELVYTQKDPLIVGHTYTAKEIADRAREATIIISHLGYAFQLLNGEWSSVVSDRPITNLFNGNYTVVWVQE